MRSQGNIWAIIFFLSISYGEDYALSKENIVEITDWRNKKFVLSFRPERIVTLSSGDVEIFYAIGAEKLLVGVPDNTKYPSEAKKIDKIGGMYGKFSAEKIVAKKPDLVIMTMSGWERYEKNYNLLKGYGINVIGLKYPSSFDELAEHIRKLGVIAGKKSEGDSLAYNILKRRDSIVNITSKIISESRPKVYMEWLTTGRKGSSAGGKDRNNELISLAGGLNIFYDVNNSSFTASDEEIIYRNPDVIIITTDDFASEKEIINYICSKKGYQNISAVKNKRVYVIEASLTWANPRLIEGLIKITKILHPEIFK